MNYININTGGKRVMPPIIKVFDTISLITSIGSEKGELGNAKVLIMIFLSQVFFFRLSQSKYTTHKVNRVRRFQRHNVQNCRQYKPDSRLQYLLI